MKEVDGGALHLVYDVADPILPPASASASLLDSQSYATRIRELVSLRRHKRKLFTNSCEEDEDEGDTMIQIHINYDSTSSS
jgi:hypothetical protein